MRVLTFLALTGCAVRSPAAFDPGSPVSPETPAGAPLTAVVMAADPPLPGESVAGWPGLGDPPSGRSLSVEEAVAAALARHPELEAAAADLEAARARRNEAGRLPDPTVEVEWLPGGELEGSLSLDLTDLAVAPLRRGVAGAALEAERARAAAKGLQLAYEVRVAVFEAQAADEELSLAQRALDGQAAARDTARAMAEAGNAPALDLAVREAAYEKARLAVSVLEQRRNEARVALEGLVPDLPEWSVPALAALPQGSPPADAEVRAVAASQELSARRAELTGLGRAAAVASTRGWPDVSVGLRGVQGEQGEWLLGGMLETSIPLPGQGSAARGAAVSTLHAERARTESEAIRVRTAARLAVARVEAADARALHLREVVLPLQQRVTRETLLQYNAMQLGIFALVDAQAAELEVARAEVEARRAAWEARAALDTLLLGVRVDASPSSRSLSTSSDSGAH